MLLSLDQVVARIVKPWWMQLVIQGDKTCEITPGTMGRRCRRGKTHLLMHPTTDSRNSMPNLIAELHPGPPLGPYTEDMVETMMDDSVRLNFLIGMSSYELRQFIRATALGEVYVYRYSKARVCTELTWVDKIYNNNPGFLGGWNESRRCTRFCFSHERPVPARMGEQRGGPLPARWKLVSMPDPSMAGIARWSQLVRVKPVVKKEVWAFKIPRKVRVVVID